MRVYNTNNFCHHHQQERQQQANDHRQGHRNSYSYSADPFRDDTMTSMPEQYRRQQQQQQQELYIHLINLRNSSSSNNNNITEITSTPYSCGITNQNFNNNNNNNNNININSDPFASIQQQAAEVVSLFSSTSTTCCNMDCFLSNTRASTPTTDPSASMKDCCAGYNNTTTTTTSSGGPSTSCHATTTYGGQLQLPGIPEEVVLCSRGGDASSAISAAVRTAAGSLVDFNYIDVEPTPLPAEGILSIAPPPVTLIPAGGPTNRTARAAATGRKRRRPSLTSSIPTNFQMQTNLFQAAKANLLPISTTSSTNNNNNNKNASWQLPSAPLPRASTPTLRFSPDPLPMPSTIGLAASKKAKHLHNPASIISSSSVAATKNNEVTTKNRRNPSISSSITHAARRRFQLMTRGTKLVSKTFSPVVIVGIDGTNLGEEEEQQPQKQELYLKTHALLGKGAFASVSSVTVEAKGTANNLSETKKPCYYACKSIKEELFQQVLDAKASINSQGGCSSGCCSEDSKREAESKQKKHYRGYIQAESQLAYEAHILGSISHTNIIKSVGFFWPSSDKSSPAFGSILNMLPGLVLDRSVLLTEILDETLAQKLKKWKTATTCDGNNNPSGRSRKLEKLSICQQLADALEHLHSHNIAYRDVKPENIGFKGSKLKLFDFGLSREMIEGPPPSTVSTESNESDATASDNSNSSDNNPVPPSPFFIPLCGVVGTMRYMAPEVCLDEPYDCDCDLYSYSVISWEIWTHRTPYLNLTPSSYKEKVCEGGLRPPEHAINQCQNNSQEKSPRDNSDKSTKDYLSDDDLRYETPPKAISALLEKGWARDSKSRIRWPAIRRELLMILQRGKS